MKEDNIKVKGHRGTWYVIGKKQYPTGTLYLLEHEQYGDDAASVIISEDGTLMMEDVHNGFDDYDYMIDTRTE